MADRREKYIGMFCKEHRIAVRKTGYCGECAHVVAVENLCKEDELSVVTEEDLVLVNKSTDADLVTQLSSKYRNKNLCPNCNPVPEELQNNESLAPVEAVTLQGWKVEQMDDYYLKKFKVKFDHPELTGLARRGALKKAILTNLKYLAR